jgi:putative membrane protein
MTIGKAAFVCGVLMWSLSSIEAADAADVSDADKAFIAKVSQGGMYEVQLAKLAERKGTEENIRDQGNTEAHDHELVGAKLKAIAKAAGLEFPTKLNSEFQARLDKMKALPGVRPWEWTVREF